MICRIAVIGPESTGKTTLCSQLALHYNTLCVPEYAREYIGKLKKHYTKKDLELIAREQINQENDLLGKATKFLFVDTELIISKVWFEDVYQTCPPWITQHISENPFNYYLLTAPDLPWIADEVRENGDRREYFFSLYKKELDTRRFSYAIITGTGVSRFDLAVSKIDHFIKTIQFD